MENITYRIIIEPDEKDTYHAYVPALKGCHTWGKSLEQTRKLIRDAIDVYLKSLIADGEKIPIGTLKAILKDMEISDKEFRKVL